VVCFDGRGGGRSSFEGREDGHREREGRRCELESEERLLGFESSRVRPSVRGV